MKKGTENKVIAACGTVAFMALVRPDTMPTMWQTAVLAIGMYEVLLVAVRAARRAAYRDKMTHYIRISREDVSRWADEVFNPIKEVV